MASKFVGATNRPVLIAAGIALLLLAIAAMARTNWNDYRLPAVILAGPAIKYAILGIALLFVAIRRSRFADALAVIVATFLIFGFVFFYVVPLAFGLSARVNWWTAIDLAIAAAILWSLMFPGSRSANKRVLSWIALTFGLLTLLMGSLMILARL